jgi:hypothetical protein
MMKDQSVSFERADFYPRLVLVALGIVMVIYAFSVPVKSLAYFFSDDAYYYYKVAQNIVSGLGSTFDGFNKTNGYHPLWMLILLPVFGFTRDNPVLSLRLVFVLMGIISLLSLWLCWIYIKATGSRFLGLIGVLLLLGFPSLYLMLNGLESGLLIFWIFFILFLDMRYDLLDNNASLPKRLLLGWAFAFLVLARLDNALFVISLILFKLVFSPFKNRPFDKLKFLSKTYWPTALVFLGLTLPYLVFNMRSYGHWAPISGALKTSFPIPHFNFANLHTALYSFILVVSFFWVVYSSLSPRGYLRRTLFPKWQHESSYAMLAVLWLGCLFHLIWTSLFMQWGVYQWHFSTYVPILVILTVFAYRRIIDRFNNSKKIKSVLFALTIIALLGISAVIHIEKGSHHLGRYAAAAWAKDNTPPNTVFAIHDAGCFAYFSDRPTVNLDGVINSYEFQDAILEGRLLEFPNGLNVKYIASSTVRLDLRRFGRPIEYYGGSRPGDRVAYRVLVNEDAEVYATEPFLYRPLSKKLKSSFIIWDLSKVQLERRMPKPAS